MKVHFIIPESYIEEHTPHNKPAWKTMAERLTACQAQLVAEVPTTRNIKEVTCKVCLLASKKMKGGE